MEVRIAIAVNDSLDKLNSYSYNSFCKAYGILLKGLLESAVRLRIKSVGIVKGTKVTHISPPMDMPKSLLNDLFDYLKNDDGLVLMKNFVFYYEV